MRDTVDKVGHLARDRIFEASFEEVLTTVGEQVGCLLVLSRMAPDAVEAASHVDLVLASAQR